MPQKQFRETTGKILRELRESGKIPGEEKIYTPGEKAYRNEVRVARDGVEIPPAVQKSLQALCDALNVPGLDLES